jgi:hypothetical protein
LTTHMREPNSLILAASALHETEPDEMSVGTAMTVNPRAPRRNRPAVANPIDIDDDGARRAVAAAGTRTELTW